MFNSVMREWTQNEVCTVISSLEWKKRYGQARKVSFCETHPWPRLSLASRARRKLEEISHAVICLCGVTVVFYGFNVLLGKEWEQGSIIGLQCFEFVLLLLLCYNTSNFVLLFCTFFVMIFICLACFHCCHFKCIGITSENVHGCKRDYLNQCTWLYTLLKNIIRSFQRRP